MDDDNKTIDQCQNSEEEQVQQQKIIQVLQRGLFNLKKGQYQGSKNRKKISH